MPRVLGYGGIGNTNGARDFSGKTPSIPVSGSFRNRGRAIAALRYAGKLVIAGLLMVM